MNSSYIGIGLGDGLLDMRFSAWCPVPIIYLGRNSVLVVELVPPKSAALNESVYLWAIVTSDLQLKCGRPVGNIAYDREPERPNGGTYRISDSNQSVSFDTCYFRIAADFSLSEYLKAPGGPFPTPVIYDSKQGENDAVDMPHPDEINALCTP